jgi:hypothetical protein
MINVVQTYEVTSEDHFHINDPSGFMRRSDTNEGQGGGGGVEEDDDKENGNCGVRCGENDEGRDHDHTFDDTMSSPYWKDTQIHPRPRCQFSPQDQGWNAISTLRER